MFCSVGLAVCSRERGSATICCSNPSSALGGGNGAGQFDDQGVADSRAASSPSPAARSTRAGCLLQDCAPSGHDLARARRPSSLRCAAGLTRALQVENDATLSTGISCSDLEAKASRGIRHRRRHEIDSAQGRPAES